MTIRRTGSQELPIGDGPQRLPLRWVVIAILTAAAAVGGLMWEGPVAAIASACAVAVAFHRLIA